MPTVSVVCRDCGSFDIEVRDKNRDHLSLRCNKCGRYWVSRKPKGMA